MPKSKAEQKIEKKIFGNSHISHIYNLYFVVDNLLDIKLNKIWKDKEETINDYLSQKTINELWMLRYHLKKMIDKIENKGESD